MPSGRETPPPPYELHDPRSMQREHRTAAEDQVNDRTRRHAPRVDHRQRRDAGYSGQDSAWQDSSPLGNPEAPSRYDESGNFHSISRNIASADQVAAVAARLNDVFTSIDDGEAQEQAPEMGVARGMFSTDNTQPNRSKRTLIDFSKTWLYANSRLPPYMPPFRVYVSTWQIICAAAQASNDVYRRPRRPQGDDDYIDADVWHGTKAMSIHTQQVEVHDKQLVVLAIRGSKWNPVDWAVNFRPAPTAPTGFLDDDGNACHAGFLAVARNMVAPVAARLRAFLARAPPTRTGSRPPWSLLLTGHSAGGAVASLLYAHMLSHSTTSELSVLADSFKRVHCVTFGAPPLSFLPLQRPIGPESDDHGHHRRSRHAKSVFLAFANEGDPVVRADRQYIHNMVRLLAAPAPGSGSSDGRQRPLQRRRRAQATLWEVPVATLSNAGRLVLLRERPSGQRHRQQQQGGIEAVQLSDDELRTHVFGDPAMHAMALYKLRVDELAVEAITGRHLG